MSSNTDQKFKVGDRIRCTSKVCPTITFNKIYVVERLWDKDGILIEVKNDNGHLITFNIGHFKLAGPMHKFKIPGYAICKNPYNRTLDLGSIYKISKLESDIGLTKAEAKDVTISFFGIEGTFCGDNFVAIERDFQVGDKVKVIDDKGHAADKYIKQGEIYTVKGVEDRRLELVENSSGYAFYKYRFELIEEENNKEEKINNMETEFKAGDKVICNNNNGRNNLSIDNIYTVSSAEGEHIYLTEFGISCSFNKTRFSKYQEPKNKSVIIIVTHGDENFGKLYLDLGAKYGFKHTFVSDITSNAPAFVFGDVFGVSACRTQSEAEMDAKKYNYTIFYVKQDSYNTIEAAFKQAQVIRDEANAKLAAEQRAAEEERKKAEEEAKIPKVNGYKLELVERGEYGLVKFGCAQISIKRLIHLVNAFEQTHPLENRSLEYVSLSSKVILSREDIKKIVEYIIHNNWC